ncbi:hypothetical protein [Actinomadura sp. BRA 177]|uniref:hypothetical protein n=1 Tax=Actinomadura sp. BRA 177 TaxID=2745202 RepID=UPI001595EB38|nr:hypothetical protein [Actinomadura sp. BRA 177]NVI89220.1 hypothetical protein [Actinomadura sp. BRA 177]
MTDAQVIEVRRLIDGLRWDRRRDPYRGRREYAARAGEVAAEIDHLIKREAAAQAVPLARRAVERVTSTLMYLDDSPGIVGDQLRELMFLYAEACKAAPPDAGRLAAWLVKTRLDGPGWPDIRLAEFKDALGERGLREAARLVEERRATDDPDSWTATVGVRDMREQLAAVSGDVDAHVAVLAEDLRGTYRYTKIVQVLRAAGRDAEAERWAREGLARDGAGHQADVLRDRLVDLLLDHGRGDEAIALRRAALEHRTMHIDYMALRKTAERAGRWPDLRDSALSVVRGRAQVDSRYVTQLSDVLIGENLLDEAWQLAVTHPNELHESQWYRLIELWEVGHPADVIAPYRDLIELRLAATGDKYRYNKAVKTIARLREAYRRSGDEDGFAGYLAGLRKGHKRKTSFIARLDRAKLDP